MSSRGNSLESSAGAGGTGTMHAPGSTNAPSAAVAEKLLDTGASNMDAQHTAAADLASRLSGNAAFAAMASAIDRSPEAMAYVLIQSWNGDPGSPYAQALSHVVGNAFHLSGTSPISMKGEAQSIVDEHGAALRAFAQAQYQATQQFFAKAGISSLTLYRGVQQYSWPGHPPSLGVNVPPDTSGSTAVSTRPLSSFTTDPTIAQDFAEYGMFGGAAGSRPWMAPTTVNNSLVLSADVPVSRIFSIGQTGLGTKQQAEAVILGGTDTMNYTYSTYEY